MKTNENEEEDSKKKRFIQVNTYDQGYICLMGKNITPEKLQKRMRRKPRLFGTILVNISIILMIIITILLVIEFIG